MSQRDGWDGYSKMAGEKGCGREKTSRADAGKRQDKKKRTRRETEQEWGLWV